MTADTSDFDPVENRSEIVLLYDGRNCNPNGDPRSANDKPRRDNRNYGVITDSRLKRYIRDQLSEDGEGVLLENPKFNEGRVSSREALYTRLLDMSNGELAEATHAEILDEFLANAASVRYFGATTALQYEDDDDEDADERDKALENISDALPGQLHGPVQFELGESLHPVFLNSESSKLSVIAASSEDAEQGTFAEDHRIQYGMYRFHGIINENSAAGTRLSQSDVDRFDTLVWRALKNQTLTRSKVGQQPRLYIRIEYRTDNYQIGNLHHGIDLDEESSADPRNMANLGDVTLDTSRFRQVLRTHADKINTVHIAEDEFIDYTEIASLTTHLSEIFGDESTGRDTLVPETGDRESQPGTDEVDANVTINALDVY